MAEETLKDKLGFDPKLALWYQFKPGIHFDLLTAKTMVQAFYNQDALHLLPDFKDKWTNVGDAVLHLLSLYNSDVNIYKTNDEPTILEFRCESKEEKKAMKKAMKKVKYNPKIVIRKNQYEDRLVEKPFKKIWSDYILTHYVGPTRREFQHAHQV